MAAVNIKCPSCGGELVFDPSTQQYACPYCGSHFDQQQLDGILREQQPSQEPETAAFDEQNSGDPFSAGQPGMGESPREDGQEAVIYRCPSCGAEILTDETTAATFCCFCHNPVILEGRVSGKFLPDRVIPFSISRDMAVEKFLAAMKKKWFVRRGFFQKNQIEKLTGVYLPCWDADWEGDASLHADATRVRVWRSGDTEFTETRFYHVIREGHLRFEGLTKNALKKADREMAEGVHPYRQQEKKPFSVGFLSGFQAERRDVEWEDVQPEIERDARAYSERLLRESIQGYATVTGQQMRFGAEQMSREYLMVPVWMLTYRGKDGKMYYYAMNGQTGEVCGRLPLDYGRLGAVSGILAVVVFLLMLLGGYLL